MKNKFELDLPENGFGFPCNICKKRHNDVSECRDCIGYSGPFVADRSDIEGLMEQEAQDGR